MDIQVSSNFERAIFDASNRQGDRVRSLMTELAQGGFDLPESVLQNLRKDLDSHAVSEAKTRETIAQAYQDYDELLCPHSAVGVHAAEHHKAKGVPMITLATAHPAKFPDAVEEASGIRPDLPAHMSDLFDPSERITQVDNDLHSLKALVQERIS